MVTRVSSGHSLVTGTSQKGWEDGHVRECDEWVDWEDEWVEGGQMGG